MIEVVLEHLFYSFDVVVLPKFIIVIKVDFF